MRQNNVESFWRKVNKNGGISKHRPELGKCWEWLGALRKDGYANFKFKNENVLAHRFSYLAIHESIPIGLEIDHLCMNKSCVRTSHLEAVTKSVNLRRAFKVNPKRGNRCPRGHEFTKENTYIFGKEKVRVCKMCKKNREKKKRRERKAHVVKSNN